MNALWVLLRNEFRIVWNEFKITIKSHLTLILILALIDAVGIIFWHQILLIGYSMKRIQPLELLRSVGLDEGELILAFNLWLLSKLVKGVCSPSFAQIFERPDVSLLFPSPASPPEVFLSKYVKRMFFSLIKWTLLLAHLLLVIPFSLSLTRIFMLLFVIFVFTVIGDTFEHLIFFLKIRIIRERYRRFNFSILTFTLFLVISSLILFCSRASSLFPSVILTQTIIYATGESYQMPLSPLINLIALCTAMVLVASLLAKNDYYEEVDTILNMKSSQKLRFLSRDFFERGIMRLSNPSLLIAFRDFWSEFGNPSGFFRMTLGYFGLVVVCLSKNTILIPLKIPESIDFHLLLTMTILLVSLSIVSSSILCFAKEGNNIYILMGAPILTESIVMGKYLYSVFSSILTAMPIILSVAVLLCEASPLLLAGFTFYFLLILNAVAVMIGAYYPQFSSRLSFAPIRLFFAFYFLGFLAIIIIPLASYSLIQNPIGFFSVIAALGVYVWFVIKVCLKKASEGLLECAYWSPLSSSPHF